jgi:tRNA pseudouridine38-40 synthase
MLSTIKLTIEYDGTNFKGWQIQKKGERTVQGEIKKALKTIFKKDINIIGSGRTDSGVHALGQVAHFKTSSLKSLEEIKSALNANLDHDISILEAKKVPATFHAQFSVKSKTYRYTILNRNVRCSINQPFCLHHPHTLNLRLMRQEAKSLIGRKNFKSFQSSNGTLKSPKTSIRTIKAIEIKKRGDFITIDLKANGFLYKMVRNIVGTLLEIGSGKKPKGTIKAVLSKKNRIFAGSAAKARGLALVFVQY